MFNFQQIPNCTVKTIQGNYTVLITDDVLLIDATNSAITVTLPPPSDIIANYMHTPFNIKKIDASANAVTVASASNIDGAGTYVLSVQYQSVTVMVDNTGSTFYIL